MPLGARAWLDLVDREYLRDFVSGGGAAVKFVIAEPDQLSAAARALCELAARHGFLHVAIDAAATKLHMVQDVFFAIARALDWNAMAQHFVESLLAGKGYAWPRPGHCVALREIAERNRIDEKIIRPNIEQWLTAEIMRDTAMAQDFRVAMARLFQRRLEAEDSEPGVTAPVLEWLRGELRRVSALKGTFITAKITRHNGRAMLRSLCRWLRLCGWRGLVVTLDIRQLAKTGMNAGDGIRYSPAAVMDGFEVLRQLIDDGEHFCGLLLVVLADQSLVGDDPRRSLDAYLALKMRIWDDVRAEGLDNPLAPLVQLVGGPAL